MSNNNDHGVKYLDTPEECIIQIGSSKPLSLSSGRYSKYPESSSGNKYLKAGIDWTTGILDPFSFKIAIVASMSGLRSCVIMMHWHPVLSIRWAVAEAEFLGDIVKTTLSTRMIPSAVVAYTIVSGRKGTMSQRDKMEGNGRMFFTRIGQQCNDGLHSAGLWLRELEQIANIARSTMDCTNPRGEFDLFALSRSIFVDVRDVVWAVNTVEIYEFCRSQTEV